MPRKLRHNWCENRNKMIDAMFDCIGVVVEELISNSSENADKDISQFFKEVELCKFIEMLYNELKSYRNINFNT